MRDSRMLPKWDTHYDSETGYQQPQRFYQWRLTRPEFQRELELRGFRVIELTPIHKVEGVHRGMQWDFRVFKEGTLFYRMMRRALSLVFPASIISHMIFAVAERN